MPGQEEQRRPQAHEPGDMPPHGATDRPGDPCRDQQRRQQLHGAAARERRPGDPDDGGVDDRIERGIGPRIEVVRRGRLVGVGIRARRDHLCFGEDDTLRVIELEGIAQDRRLIVRDATRLADQQHEGEREDGEGKRLRPVPADGEPLRSPAQGGQQIAVSVRWRDRERERRERGVDGAVIAHVHTNVLDHAPHDAPPSSSVPARLA